jgi:hypothetical protein
MREVFADTFYFLALANSNDQAHAEADAAFGESSGTLVTTTWVLNEVGNAMSRLPHRGQYLALLDLLLEDPQAVTLAAEQSQFDAGLSLYRSRADKEWSMTDCISFVVMKERGIKEALTADHHFEQAGFKALLK